MGQLTNLRTLDLGEHRLTDAGVRELANLTHLQSLDLHQSLGQNDSVTDAGLEALAKLTNLRTLNLTGTRVTDRGKMELQKRLPRCQITK